MSMATTRPHSITRPFILSSTFHRIEIHEALTSVHDYLCHYSTHNNGSRITYGKCIPQHSICSNATVQNVPIWFRSEFNLIPTLSIIGNVSKSTGILLLNGENDSHTPVQQAFLLQQR